MESKFRERGALFTGLPFSLFFFLPICNSLEVNCGDNWPPLLINVGICVHILVRFQWVLIFSDECLISASVF